MTAGANLKDTVERILAAHTHLEGPLLPILHALQGELGHIPREAIPLIAHGLNLTRAEVYGVVSFYSDFRETPPGRRIVKLCRAEACQAVGTREIHEAVLKHFKIGWGETTADGALTIEPVYCLGLCSLSPAALIDDEPVAGLHDAAKMIAAIEAP